MFSRLVTELNDFLRPFYISTTTDIFEETALKLAGIEKQPEKCHFGPGDEDESLMKFKIRGIDAQDAQKFLDFLKENGDQEASMTFVAFPEDDNFSSDDEELMLDEMFDAYHFTVNIDLVFEKLVRLFKDEITKIKQNNPEKLENYKKQCENENAIKEIKLMDAINSQLDEIEKNQNDAFIKGELFVIYHNLKACIDHNKAHRELDCGSGQQLLDACNLFIIICQKIPTLKDSDILKQIKDNFKKYCDLTCTSTQLNQMMNQMLMPLMMSNMLRSPMPAPKPRTSFVDSVFNLFGSNNNHDVVVNNIDSNSNSPNNSNPDSEDEASLSDVPRPNSP